MKDLIVIGAGMAGVTAARKCAQASWDVGIVDALPYGGTCALRGCDPKKMLRRGAEVIDAARLMVGKGIDPDGLKINWADLMAHKRTFTDAVPEKMESGLAGVGVDTLHGQVRFVDERTLETSEGTRIEARHFLIATGSKPRQLEFPGAQLVADSTDFLELEDLPDRIVFIGGGYVSFEFAHIAARAGADVTIVDRGDRPLKNFDPDLVQLLLDRTRKLGIKIHQNADVLDVRGNTSEKVVSLATDGANSSIACDLVVHGAGRVPAIDDLSLDNAGVEWSERGVKVHPHLQSISAPNVFAAGDAADTSGSPLTPVAVFEGKVAASNMLKGTTTNPDYRGVPSAVFTVPELVRVGMLEEEATNAGIDVTTKWTDTSGWFSQRRMGETHSAAKIIYNKQSGQLLGAHLFGPDYSEVINIVGLAMRLELAPGDLKKMVSAYPSTGSDLGSLL